MFRSLEIKGLRGFADAQTIEFAIPANSKPGSGLTVIVGPNNAGKTTVVEALQYLLQNYTQPTSSISEGRRNKAAGDIVCLKLTDINENVDSLETIIPGASEAKRTSGNNGGSLSSLFIIQSRKGFGPFFGAILTDRETYAQQAIYLQNRSSVNDIFPHRLFSIQESENERRRFNETLNKIVPKLDWRIDLADHGQFYLKVRKGDADHNSDGLGEGFISLLFLIDALYDSKKGHTIVIDEPELSLHPALQRKLSALFTEYAKDRQIILSTHSPYFVNLNALENGARIIRVHCPNGQSKIFQLSPATANQLTGILRDRNNPHTLGLNAQEVFFLDDHIILVEGQEDTYFYKEIVLPQLEKELAGDFFGWGVGGASKMKIIAKTLIELGFRKVVGILDGNEKDIRTELEEIFQDYRFFCIPANDVRTKAATDAKQKIDGLLNDENKKVREKHIPRMNEIIDAANNYLRSD